MLDEVFFSAFFNHVAFERKFIDLALQEVGDIPEERDGLQYLVFFHGLTILTRTVNEMFRSTV